MADLPTGTVTFLFTDIEGSTRLWELHPEAMREALGRHDVLLRHVIASNGGHVFKTIGDQFCAAFATTPAAIAAALAAQQALQTEAWEETGPLKVRMALHTGTAQQREDDYFGPALNRVARLLEAGHGGQVLLSQVVAERTGEALPREARLRDLGSHHLKDLQQPEHLFLLLHPTLPADFPPLRSLEAFAHNLPAQLTRFIGREREMTEVKRLLSASHLLTLTGSGGCGKTRLALQVAADLVEEYADGVWLVELAALADPALVPQMVASTLGVREEPSRPMTRMLLEYLRPRHLLLVVDNCEHLLADCAALADSLLRGCPKLRILASSREGLGVAGEQTYRVPSLSMPDPEHLPSLERLQEFEAVQLFAARAALSQPAFAVTAANAPAVVQVCRRLDGIPLAIELAAARVKVLPVEQIATRLDDRFRLLTGGSRTALPRQQTLRALIDWSYDLLSEPERILLRRLAVFAGGWTLEAAEAVCAGGVPTEGGARIEDWEVLDLLTRLVEKSLVLYGEEEEQARYRLLETVRQYGRDRLMESGEAEAARERHLEWHLALAERAEHEIKGRDQVAWIGRLDAERDNLRLALAWAQERLGGRKDAAGGEPRVSADAGLRLAGALGFFWDIHGYYAEGWEALERALVGGAAPDRVRAKALLAAGSLVGPLGEWQRGRELLEESLALWRSLDDQPGIAETLNLLCGVIDDHSAARAVGEESLAISRAIGDQWNTAHALSNLGSTALEQGDHESARLFFEESLSIQRDLGDTRGMAGSLGDLGKVAWHQGNSEAACGLCEESLLLHRRLGQVGGITSMVGVLAQLARERGDEETVRRLTEEALASGRMTGDKASLAWMFSRLGWAAFFAGDLSSARAHFEQTMALRREVGNAPAIRYALRGLGAVAIAAGEYAAARTPLEESLRLEEECGRPSDISLSLWRLGDAARGAGDYERARAHYQEALALARAAAWDEMIAEYLPPLGLVALKQGDLEAALPLLRESLTLWQRMGFPGMIRCCMECLAQVAGAQGQPGRAARLLGAAEAMGELPRSQVAQSFQLVPLDPADNEAAASAAHAALGAEAFAAAWAQGRAMSLDRAIAYALEEVGDA